MAEKSMYEKMKALVGKESGPVSYAVERGHVKRFVEATGDPNPLYQHEVQARKTRYGGVIAPPTFAKALLPENEVEELWAEGGDARILYASAEWEYFQPIRVGDTICVTSRLADVYQKQGRLGSMTFIVVEVVYKNQFGELVVKLRDTNIHY